MTITYLPVTKIEKYPSYRYWMKNPYFQYNNLLVTPFVTGLDKKRRHFKDSVIYADSGGFQIAMQHKKVRAIDILIWQQGIANVGFTVDVPPHSFEDKYSPKQFSKCMYKSNINADLMWRFKTTDMQLYGVIQGRTIDELSLWYNDLTKDHIYDGYCISLSINRNAKGNIPWLPQLEFAKTIDKSIHFLGSSSPVFVLVLAKFSKIMKQCYTFDTSSSNIAVRFGKYIVPKDFKQISFSLNEKPVKLLPCSCPVCTKHSIGELRYVKELIVLHNLYTLTQFCKFANFIADFDDLYISVLNKWAPKNAKDILNLIYEEIPEVNNQVVDEQKQQIAKEFQQWLKNI
jgi:tRNA-guanine family transglycosylase